MPDWLSEKRQKLYYVLDREVKKEGGSSLSIYALSSSADTGGGHGRTRGRSSASHARLLSLSLSLSSYSLGRPQLSTQLRGDSSGTGDDL